MIVDVQRTEDAILIKLPLSALPDDIESVLTYFRYIELGSKSKITQDDVDAFVKETKGVWWKKNKQRFIGAKGFENME